MTDAAAEAELRGLRDSRRLTGPNVLADFPGAVLDAAVGDDEADSLADAWETAVQALCEVLRWPTRRTARRRFPGGLSLLLEGPMDALYVATELNEWAWSQAVAAADGPGLPLEAAAVEAAAAEAAPALKKEWRGEANPPLLRLQRAAAREGVAFLTDDDHVSVGLGRHATTWPVRSLPEAGDVDWAAYGRVPTAMITGTNGKTTTVRMLRAMVLAAELVPGLSSTDWLMVGDEVLDRGDWSGPGGARTILRDPRVDVALLETARGGMLRRGLGLPAGEADVALVTNIAEDHLGEWGIQDLDMLADTKFIIRRAGKRLVLNADDACSVARQELCTVPLTWFSLDAEQPLLVTHRRGGGHAAWLEDGALWWQDEAGARALLPVAEVPVTMDGAARHNVANALAAVAVAFALGLPEAAILAGLRGFRSDAHDNPGRLNRFDIDGATVLVDFAHNPHGLEALFEMAAAMPAKRRLVTIGHAGDRSDDAIRDVALSAWRSGVDRILIKEQEEHLRGREPGEIPRIMHQALIEAGCPEDRIGMTGSELEAAEQALDWAEPGDLLLILALAQREEVLGMLRGRS